jgi:hypothetical protein
MIGDVLLVVGFAAASLEGMLTKIMLSSIEGAREANPLAAYLMKHVGLSITLVITRLPVFLLVSWLYLRQLFCPVSLIATDACLVAFALWNFAGFLYSRFRD